MKFKLDKHNVNDVYWLAMDVYGSLKSSKYLNQDGQQDWEIGYLPIVEGNLPNYEERVLLHMKSIKRGDILQPIIVLNQSNVIDGRHKL